MREVRPLIDTHTFVVYIYIHIVGAISYSLQGYFAEGNCETCHTGFYGGEGAGLIIKQVNLIRLTLNSEVARHRVFCIVGDAKLDYA